MHKIGRLQVYFILFIAMLLHLTVLDRINIAGAKPDLLLIAIIFFGLFSGRRMGLESGLAAGLLKDLFALDFFGVNAFILAITGYLVGVLGDKFSRESNMTRCLLVILLTAFAMILHFMIVSAFSRWTNLNFGEYIAGSVIPTCAYTALISIPVFYKLIKTYAPRGSDRYL